MPVAKNKSNTSRATSSTPTTGTISNQGVALPELLPQQLQFHQQLRAEALAVLRPFLQKVMREELDALIGCEWGEHSKARQGYRNGYYQRDLGTANGTLKGLKVPRDREGAFHTQVFERYRRYEPQIEEGLTQVFVAGVSTDKVGQVAETLMGLTPSKSAISRMNADLSQQFEQWRQRKLASQWQIIYLDGVYYTRQTWRGGRLHAFSGSLGRG